jgi:hypothetical protein
MTGALDVTAPPVMATNYFNAAGAFPTKGLANKLVADHSEPDVERYGCLHRRFARTQRQYHHICSPNYVCTMYMYTLQLQPTATTVHRRVV